METLTGHRPREQVVTSGRQCWAAANNPAFRPSTTNVVANLVFASKLQGGQQQANVFYEYGSAGKYLTSPYEDLLRLDLYPKTEQLGNKPIDLSPFIHYLDRDRDFNGVKRNGQFVGAYGGKGINP
ncbi:MAG: hypothetical protein GY934_18990, partial [Gammaproteobacteria bacterium]|nr:hypothetical protein [Gammaproteobacteria bacterium]